MRVACALLRFRSLGPLNDPVWVRVLPDGTLLGRAVSVLAFELCSKGVVACNRDATCNFEGNRRASATEISFCSFISTYRGDAIS
jgi:hypothetical protein